MGWPPDWHVGPGAPRGNPFYVGFAVAGASRSGQTAMISRPTAIPIDTSTKRCNAETHPALSCDANTTIARVVPAKRYAVRSLLADRRLARVPDSVRGRSILYVGRRSDATTCGLRAVYHSVGDLPLHASRRAVMGNVVCN